jgi:hypothetical protein
MVHMTSDAQYQAMVSDIEQVHAKSAGNPLNGRSGMGQPDWERSQSVGFAPPIHRRRTR